MFMDLIESLKLRASRFRPYLPSAERPSENKA